MSHGRRGSRLRCCVEGCLSKSSENSGLSFHQLPRPDKGHVARINLFGKKENFGRLQQWLKVLKIKNPGPSMKVCSLHFKRSDFRELLPELPTKRPYLLETAVPSLNLPKSDTEKKNEKRDQARLNRRISRRLSQQDENPCPPSISNNALMTDSKASFENILQESQTKTVDTRQCVSNVVDNALLSNNQPIANVDMELVTVKVEIFDEHNEDNCDEGYVNNEEEVDAHSDCTKDHVLALISKQNENTNNKKSRYKFTDTLDNDEKLCAITGLATLKILDTIVESVRLLHGNQFDSENFSTRDKIILTYMKLKHNLSYTLLTILFQLNNAQNCEKIFKQMMPTLDKILSGAWSHGH